MRGSVTQIIVELKKCKTKISVISKDGIQKQIYRLLPMWNFQYFFKGYLKLCGRRCLQILASMQGVLFCEVEKTEIEQNRREVTCPPCCT